MNDLVAPRKVLISYGFGAGWSSWAYGEEGQQLFALTYAPIIEFLENGGRFIETYDPAPIKQDPKYKALEAMSKQVKQSPNEAEIARKKMNTLEQLYRWEEPGRSVLAQFLEDFDAKFPDDSFYLGGAIGLVVKTVHGRIRVNEYDGAESYEIEGNTNGFM